MLKTKERDGYSAAQIGRVRDDYAHESFSPEWLTEPKKYFSVMKEVRFINDEHELAAGRLLILMTFWLKATMLICMV